MHNAAQFELDAPADRQPMQLEKTWSDVLDEGEAILALDEAECKR